MGSAYVVGVARLLREVPSSLDVAFQAPFDEFHEFSPRGPVDTDVEPDAPVDVALRLESYLGGIRARGRVEVPWRGVCRRCSREVMGRSSLEVDERFVTPEGPADDESYPIEHNDVNLAPLVHDAVFLDLPLAPLCRDDCRGLCPVCGIDRNEDTCTCREPLDSRWATLDALRFAESESHDDDVEFPL